MAEVGAVKVAAGSVLMTMGCAAATETGVGAGVGGACCTGVAGARLSTPLFFSRSSWEGVITKGCCCWRITGAGAGNGCKKLETKRVKSLSTSLEGNLSFLKYSVFFKRMKAVFIKKTH